MDDDVALAKEEGGEEIDAGSPDSAGEELFPN